MNRLILVVLFALLAGCGEVSAAQAQRLAYERLAELENGPSLQGEALRSSLRVTRHANGTYLVELTDTRRNLLWAVIVTPAGHSEISRMAIDG